MTGRTRATLAVTLLLAIFGVLVGFLMTWHHDTQLYAADAVKGALVGCTETAEVNCDIVNTSAWSELGGVPIATLAIGFYATVGVLAILGLRGREQARPILVAMGVGAVAYSALLFWVSRTELGYVCAWCIRLYGTNLGILVATLAGGRIPRPDARTVGLAAGTLLLLSAVSAAGERIWRGTLSGGAPSSDLTASADHSRDPTGPAPARTIDVTTEDNHPAKLVIAPDDAWLGNPAGKVTVVMFGDLECGFCKRSAAEMSRLEAAYADRVLFVFKHFPLDPACNPGVKNKKHKDACAAARASVCAQEEGRFWAFHDLAYKNQHELGDPALRAYAVEAGVDGAKFDACFASDRPLDVVRGDAQQGADIDIHGTPRIYIDGTLYRSGTSAQAMARAIELALGADPAAAAKAAAKLQESEADVAPIPADVPATRDLELDGLSFGIDTFEAAIEDGKAVSGKHEVPAMGTSWYEAKSACEAAGRRMCTEEEWVSACQGARAKDDDANGTFADDMIEGTAYPYGDYHADGRCWDAQDPGNSRPAYTGEMPGCVTAAGVYDLTGNMEEWAGDTPERAVLLGGAFDTSEDHARCYRRNDTFGPGFSAPRTGFRCCGP